jgi:tRNA threonylcarbamoyladenosine biosynthesis protein TsaB
LILALDAATSTVVLGLAASDGRILSERRLSGGRGDVLPGLLEECLAETGARASDISSVVCGIGPGSFTGIRIALSFGHGLAFRRHLPYRGVSSLAAALHSPALDKNRPAVALLDALRGEAYLCTGPDAVDIRLPLADLPQWRSDLQLVAEGRPDFIAALPAGWLPLSEHVSVAGLLAARTHASDPVPNYLRASAPEEMRVGSTLQR